ncbi:MAG: hypothetical protein PHW82_17175, partial [Bacteroidales bacterium]|nr:hypothetical protein [Bacteroidales bacterium]
MNYNLVINGTKTTTIYVPANEETIANIIIDSLNTVDSKYELIYKVCTNEDCDSLIDTPENLLVEYSSRTTDAVTGEIPASESKIVRLGITNNTDNGYYLLFDINAGYIHSTLALQNQIINEYNEDVTIAAIIDGDISTTFPTTSDFIATVECKTNKEESNAEGTATWNGTKWTLDITGADSGKTVCNVYFKGPYNEKKGVNRPVLFTGMTPVKWVWDDEKEIYEEASPVNYDEDWYDYNAKKWANAKTADGSYWVWIPRYAYKITDGYHSSTTGTIDIEFLRGTTNDNDSSTNIKPTEEYNADTKNTSDNHFLHPAFDVEGSKLGFWIAKYEPTYVGVATITGTCDSEDNIITNKTVQILPGATSWRCINV